MNFAVYQGLTLTYIFSKKTNQFPVSTYSDYMQVKFAEDCC